MTGYNTPARGMETVTIVKVDGGFQVRHGASRQFCTRDRIPEWVAAALKTRKVIEAQALLMHTGRWKIFR